MNLHNEIKKLLEARIARLQHQAQIAATPIDRTTRLARLAAILTTPDPANPRHARIVEIFAGAKARRDHGDLA